MKKTLLSGLAFAAAAFLTLPGGADAAQSWGIKGEQKARFEAKVVDLLCELNGDCPDNCGDGKRQLGLLKDDGTLIFVAKNQTIFAGATHDLLPYCGKTVEADGLLIDTKAMPMFAIQFHREPGGEWNGARGFGDQWKKKHEGNVNRWFDHDPTVKAAVEKDGILGIPGLEYKK